MNKEYAKALINFIDKSPNNFLATDTIKTELLNNGFEELLPCDRWELKKEGKYFVTKNDSAIFAFVIGSDDVADSGFRIICSHSDSPTFRIKPSAEIKTEGGVLKLNTEVYGGPILYTWFDRPLSIAGRVLLRTDNPLAPDTALINIERPIIIIPHLAIHLNRTVNEGNALSKQKDMLPVIAIINENCEKDNYLLNLIAHELMVSAEDIIDFDLTLYEWNKGCLAGANEEFISVGRLDDLAMAHASMNALLDSDNAKVTKVMAVFDNEETGSGTKQGAASPVLRNIMERIVLSQSDHKEDFFRAIDNSFMISADMAHAIRSEERRVGKEC